MPHELFLTTRQRTKIRNAFANNMFTDIKLSQAQLTKVIHSGRFLSNMMGNLGKKALMNFAVLLAKGVLPKLVFICIR